MTNKEAIKTIGELRSEIKMLRALKNDLLYYNRVVLCRECRRYDEGYCDYWKRCVEEEGYCNYGVRK